MQNNLFNSQSAKNLKFDNSGVGNILKIDEWILLPTQFNKYIEKSKISDNSKVKLKLPKK